MLYEAARADLAKAISKGLHVIILSGGYGLLLADEPIGLYEARFNPAWWPKGMLENILTVYATRHELNHVRAFASLTTSYRKVAERVNWGGAGINDAWLLAPEATRGGAMVKSPRAQGEALGAFVRGDLVSNWRSSDGLKIHAMQLV